MKNSILKAFFLTFVSVLIICSIIQGAEITESAETTVSDDSYSVSENITPDQTDSDSVSDDSHDISENEEMNFKKNDSVPDNNLLPDSGISNNPEVISDNILSRSKRIRSIPMLLGSTGNDIPNDATSYTIGDIVSKEITVTPGSDYEAWYSFSLDKSYVLKMTLKSAKSKHPDIHIYDASKSMMLDLYEEGSGYVGLLKGTYYIYIRERTNVSEFTDTVSFCLSSVDENNNYQTFIEEYGDSSTRNNTQDTASILSSDHVYHGIVAQNNATDWYKFTIDEDTYIQLSQVDYSSDGEISLYDSNMTRILRQNAMFNTSSKMLPEGTYYIKAERYNASANGNGITSYKIVLGTAENDYVSYNPNDAESYVLGDTITEDLSESGYNKWYTMTLENSCILHMNLQHTTSTSATPSLFIYSISGRELKNIYGPGDDYVALLKGTYYVYFNCDSLSSGTASFKITPIKKDQYYQSFEESYQNIGTLNNTLLDASKVILDKTYHGLVGRTNPVDWYELNTNTDANIRFYQHCSKDNTAGTLILYDSDQNQLLYHAKNQIEETITVPAGKYYIYAERYSYVSNTEGFTSYEFDCKTVYRVTFDKNGASGAAPDDVICFPGSNFTVTGQENMTYEKHKFLGWSENPNAKTATYAEGDKITVTKPMTLYAVWARKFKIKYDKNGADTGAAPEEQLCIEGNSITISDKGTAKYFGRIFLGWSKSANAASADYKPGDPFKPENDITLYAVWKQIIYKVGFDKNGAKTGEAPEDSDHYYGDIITIPDKETMKKPGSTFVGWSTDRRAERAEYTAGDTITVNNDMTLFAIWKPMIEDIAYSFINISNKKIDEICETAYSGWENQKFFILMFGSNELSSELYEIFGDDSHNCYGMSTTAGLFYKNGNNIDVSKFRNEAKNPEDLRRKDYSNEFELSVQDFIHCMQIAQLVDDKIKIRKHVDKDKDSVTEFVRDLKNEIDNGKPVLLSMGGDFGGSHAVLAYDYDQISDNAIEIYLYDSNYFYKYNGNPEQEERDFSKERIMTCDLSEGNISYQLALNDQTLGTLKFDLNSRGSKFSYIKYDDYLYLWNNRGRYFQKDDVLCCVDGKHSVDLYRGDAKVVSIQDSITLSDDVTMINNDSISRDSGYFNDTVGLFLPKDTYTMKNTGKTEDGLAFDFANQYYGASVKAASDTVTFYVDDENEEVKVSFPYGINGDYEIALQFRDENKQRTVTLKGTDSVPGSFVRLNGEKLSSEKFDNAKVTVDERKENTFYSLTFDEQGGSAVKDITNITPNTCVKLPITEKEGYTFGGWYDEPDGKGNKYTSETLVTKDLTLYAYWIANGSDQNDSNSTDNKDKEDPTKKTITASGGGYTAIITMNKEIPYTRNKKQVASSAGVSMKLLKNGEDASGISVKSVKAKKPKKNASSSTITIKLKGSDKETKKAVKAMNKSLKKIPITLKSEITAEK